MDKDKYMTTSEYIEMKAREVLRDRETEREELLALRKERDKGRRKIHAVLDSFPDPLYHATPIHNRKCKIKMNRSDLGKTALLCNSYAILEFSIRIRRFEGTRKVVYTVQGADFKQYSLFERRIITLLMNKLHEDSLVEIAKTEESRRDNAG